MPWLQTADFTPCLAGADQQPSTDFNGATTLVYSTEDLVQPLGKWRLGQHGRHQPGLGGEGPHVGETGHRSWHAGLEAPPKGWQGAGRQDQTEAGSRAAGGGSRVPMDQYLQGSLAKVRKRVEASTSQA